MTPADAPREAASVFDDVDANKLGTAAARRIYVDRREKAGWKRQGLATRLECM